MFWVCGVTTVLLKRCPATRSSTTQGGRDNQPATGGLLCRACRELFQQSSLLHQRRCHPQPVVRGCQLHISSWGLNCLCDVSCGGIDRIRAGAQVIPQTFVWLVCKACRPFSAGARQARPDQAPRCVHGLQLHPLKARSLPPSLSRTAL